jgi:hypothetical protein
MFQQQMQAALSHNEPAHKMYVFGDGWIFLRETQMRLHKIAEAGVQAWLKNAEDLYRSSQKTGCLLIGWFYLAILFCLSVGVLTYSFMMLMMLVFVALFASILAIGASVCLAAIVLLHFYSWLYAHIWHISYDCPHPCYRREPLPIFLCSQCPAEHRWLRPNIYGIWSHRCQCTTKLCTIEHFGRSKLIRICPNCRNPLNGDIGQGSNIHLPIIGGPSAGKTHYITAALDALICNYTAMYNYRFSFIDHRHELNFQANVRQLAHGQSLAATPEITPPAYTLKMNVPDVPVPKIMYIYDAAGEAYNANEQTHLQTYYRYVHGLIFIIDPCAITPFRLKYEQQINAISSYLRPCASEIMQVHDRMMLQLEKTRGLRKQRRYQIPIAVVVTKVDALGLEHEIGAEAARNLMHNDHSYMTEGEAIHKLVQDFLRGYGQSDLLRNLEYHFSTVRYFSCSSLGRLPVQTDSSNFIPMRVLDPLAWLLSQNGTIRQVHRT